MTVWAEKIPCEELFIEFFQRTTPTKLHLVHYDRLIHLIARRTWLTVFDSATVVVGLTLATMALQLKEIMIAQKKTTTKRIFPKVKGKEGCPTSRTDKYSPGRMAMWASAEVQLFVISSRPQKKSSTWTRVFFSPNF